MSAVLGLVLFVGRHLFGRGFLLVVGLPLRVGHAIDHFPHVFLTYIETFFLGRIRVVGTVALAAAAAALPRRAAFFRSS